MTGTEDPAGKFLAGFLKTGTYPRGTCPVMGEGQNKKPLERRTSHGKWTNAEKPKLGPGSGAGWGADENQRHGGTDRPESHDPEKQEKIERSQSQ